MRFPFLSAALAIVLLPGVCLAAENTHKISKEAEAKLFGMRGFPDVPANVQWEKFFPVIDEFGQYRHKDWPGKTKSAEDLARHKQEESADLTSHPGPDDWDQYGGWKLGPKLAATGHFRTE
jgi:hypothetical protein